MGASQAHCKGVRVGLLDRHKHKKEWIERNTHFQEQELKDACDTIRRYGKYI